MPWEREIALRYVDEWTGPEQDDDCTCADFLNPADGPCAWCRGEDAESPDSESP